MVAAPRNSASPERLPRVSSRRTVVAGLALAASLIATTPAPAPAQTPTAKPAPNAKPADADAPATRPADAAGGPGTDVAATVDGVPVLRRDVDREVRLALAGLDAPDDVRNYLAARALRQLVDRLVVQRYLDAEGQSASQADVELAWQRLVTQLERRKVPLAEHLRQQGHDESSLRRQFAWQLTWRKYLERYLTDENLQKYFDQRRRQFDGTQLRVAHILFKLPADAQPADRQAAFERAAMVRAAVAAGELTFAQAAQKHSAAPTAEKGGDIGLISRRDPMPEAFSRAAYELKKGEVGAPVETELGVHLITVLDELPGQKTFQQVRPEVETALAQYLFDWLSGRQRDGSKIEYTGKTPYLDPQSGELRLPASNAEPGR